MPGVLEEQRGGERGYSGGDEKERRGGRCQREDRHRSIRSEGEWGISSGSLVAPVLSAMGRKPPPAVSRPSGLEPAPSLFSLPAELSPLCFAWPASAQPQPAWLPHRGLSRCPRLICAPHHRHSPCQPFSSEALTTDEHQH